MATWKLLSRSPTGPERPGGRGREVVYTYEAPDGRAVAFHAHPTRSFTYVLASGETTGAELGALTEAFVAAGMDQHKFKGGFDEAVSSLDVRAPAGRGRRR